MNHTFHRRELATEMVVQLLRPGPLQQSLQSGLFFSGPRRVGKTTFLMADLIPELENQGAIVIYIDLWAQPSASPVDLVTSRIQKTLLELSTPEASLLSKLKALSQVEVGGAGFKFSFKLDQLGKPNGTTLAQAITEVVDQAKTHVVLIVDEVQHTLSSPQGGDLLYALKAAREAVNKRAGTPGRFIFIGTGSHRAQVHELVIQGNQAFQGAETREFPVLGMDYVEYVLDQVRPVLGKLTPSRDVTYHAFQSLGNRPEELGKALAALQEADPRNSADSQLPAITMALKISAGNVELARVEQLGDLAGEVFSKICTADRGATRLHSVEALAEFKTTLSRDVSAREVQIALRALSDANLVMRVAHGRYEVTDPFVRDARNAQRQFQLK